VIMDIIKFENITRRITDPSGDERVILDDVSFTVAEGEIFTIIGPSGSGKSSILRLMNRLDEPTSGQILFRDKPVADYSPQMLRRKIAMAFQGPKLFGPKVEDDLTYSYSIDSEQAGDAEISERCSELIQLVGLAADFLDREVDRLSGGEVMRVAIARALMRQPEVLLLDEPTSGLDPEAARALLGVVKELNKAKGFTIVIVTHRFNYAKLIGHRTMMIVEGSIIEIGESTEFFRNPKTEQARMFIETGDDV
jgi:ABC-type methionine transport system ATPase subunit